jgi:hypothetical protein
MSKLKNEVTIQRQVVPGLWADEFTIKALVVPTLEANIQHIKGRYYLSDGKEISESEALEMLNCHLKREPYKGCYITSFKITDSTILLLDY